jgi:hypothetical protein
MKEPSGMNIFLNSYEQPENKLTYSFLFFIEHLSAESTRALLGKLGIPIPALRSVEAKTLYGGGKGNPDGSLQLRSDRAAPCIFIENKTWRRQLDIDQLRRHLTEHVDKTSGSLLLVITADRGDKVRIANMADQRLVFSTWHDIADHLEELARAATGTLDRFLISQFSEYLERSDEAWRARMPDKKLIDAFTLAQSLKDQEKKFHLEVWRLIDSIKAEIAPTFSEEICEMKLDDLEGYIGANCHPYNQPLGHWICFCIYYDPTDHKIPLKTPFQPELAVFLGMQPENRSILSNMKGINEAIEQLSRAGYEFNFPDMRYNNPWYVCFWREEMVSRAGADPSTIKAIFEERLRTLLESNFYASIRGPQNKMAVGSRRS